MKLKILIICALLLLLLSSCGKKHITVATNAAFPPFTYFNEKNDLKGFDIDLIREICQRLSLEPDFENIGFGNLFDAMELGTADCIASAITYTPERAEIMDFSDVYYTSQQYILMWKGNTLETTEDLEGKRIAVQEGTAGDFYASDRDIKCMELMRWPSVDEAVNELRNQRTDVVILDSNAAEVFAGRYSDELELITNGIFPTQQYAFAVKKGGTELLEGINQALASIKRDGTYDRLMRRYFKTIQLD
ncbi:MAG: transporter substrate-binding domain-containing protein [Oscillospiraceae bacterium]|jgi:polar amino acid transport system substrate-binding protein|nr:transporter substrate-binding domain-containing protein [Oscillospiraceae bacterium]